MPSSFSFDYPTFFDEFGPRPRQTTYHRQRNRGVPLQNLFTDPLFKEQWYLVSGPFDFTSLEPRAKRTLDVTRLSPLECVLAGQDSIPFRSVPFRFHGSYPIPRLSNPFLSNFSSILFSRRCAVTIMVKKKKKEKGKRNNKDIYFLTISHDF